MIEGIVGLPGQGKTYEGVRRLLLAADRGRQCFSVTPIDHGNVELITYDDLTSPYLPPGLVLLDEVHLKLPSSAHARLDPAFFAKLSQTRKDGHDLIWTSQHESKVLKQLRDNTNYMWKTTAWQIGPLRFFTASCWPGESMRKGKPTDRYFHVFNGRVARAYDTTLGIWDTAAEVSR